MGVTKYNRSDRPKPYGVKWTESGKRKFKFFRLAKNRDSFYEQLLDQQKKLGHAILSLTTEEAATIKQAVDIVGNTHEVIIACKEYAERTKLISIDPQEAIEEYLKEKRLLGRDDNYIRAIANILKRGRYALPKSFNGWIKPVCHTWILGLNLFFEGGQAYPNQILSRLW